MPSFLVTRNMSPALAARVLASVRGQQGSRGRRSIAGVLRLVTLACLITAVALVLQARAQRVRELEAERSSLLHAVRAQSSAINESDRELPGRVLAMLSAQAGPAYAGDVIAGELGNEARLAEELAHPALYVRGPLDGLGRPARLGELAASSWKDAFVLCLLDPPASRSEATLKAKARAANARGPSFAVASHVSRLDPFFRALPLLGADWQERIRSAETTAELRVLRKRFDAAPVRALVQAVKARRLLAVMDEPGDPKAPTELDGERPHPVRVLLADLATSEIRLRLRRHVDPSWISPSARAEYASGIDSCALAMDVRSAVLGAPVAAAAAR